MNGSAVGIALLCLAGLVVITAVRIPSIRFRALRTVLPLTERLSVHPLRGNVYWISGGISNAGFVVGDKGVIAFDAQMFLPTARKELKTISEITKHPVNVMVLSHSDSDHINGLPAFPRGMEIIASRNASSDMQRLKQDLNSNGFPPDPAIRDYMPNRLVNGSEEMMLDGVPVLLVHTVPAHTDGDLVMYLPLQKIVFAGDLITPAIGPYPGIHLDKNGSSAGWVQAMHAILALDADLYVSGHGELLSKTTLLERVSLAEGRRAQIASMFKAGKTLKEIKKALGDVPLQGTARQFPTFIETTYQELAQATPAPHER